MQRVRRMGLLFGLLALIFAAMAGVIVAAQSSDAGPAVPARNVAMTDPACDCEECPDPTPTPTFTTPAPEPTLTTPATLWPTYSDRTRLAGMTHRIAAPRLQAIVDVDLTGFKNGDEVESNPTNGGTPPEFKKLCPNDTRVKVNYTTNIFQGDLITISFIEPGYDPQFCTVTIKVLDPRTGRVLETYESPSELILTRRDGIGFKHAPARIKVEIFCGE